MLMRRLALLSPSFRGLDAELRDAAQYLDFLRARCRLAALLAASSACRKAFRKDEHGVVNAVQLSASGSGYGARVGVGVEETRFPVSVLLAVEQSRRCRKQMVAAGACGFLQGLVAAEVDGAKRLVECLDKGKTLGVFLRT